MKRVGIFSGTFDPVHNGHIAFAEAAAKECKLDKVFLLVEPTPRRKQAVKAFEHRVNMMQLAIADKPNLGSIVLEHQQFTPKETLPVLLQRFSGAELVMLMGDDMLSHFVDWPNVDYLVNTVSFIIGARRESPAAVRKKVETISAIRGVVFDFSVIAIKDKHVSSSKVRSILRQGHSSKDLHPSVMAYIRERKLYAALP